MRLDYIFILTFCISFWLTVLLTGLWYGPWNGFLVAIVFLCTGILVLAALTRNKGVDNAKNDGPDHRSDSGAN